MVAARWLGPECPIAQWPQSFTPEVPHPLRQGDRDDFMRKLRWIEADIVRIAEGVGKDLERRRKKTKAEILVLLAKTPKLATNRSELARKTGWSRESFSRGTWPDTLERARQGFKVGRIAEQYENKGRKVNRIPPEEP
jgi:hypothetical protein